MGRMLCLIEKMPDEAIPAVQWVWDRIREERASQVAMLPDFNARLVAVGCRPVSLSAFNRYVLLVRDGSIKRPPNPAAFLATDKDALGALQTVTETLLAAATSLKVLAFNIAELRQTLADKRPEPEDAT